MAKTLEEIIAFVDGIKPNAYDNNVKTQWINEIEGTLQTEVFRISIQDIVEYDFSSDSHAELIADAPHNKLYWMYLCAMIDFANGEYSKYNNSMAMFNEAYDEYAKWVCRTYSIENHEDTGYCLSAYGIAKKHGFEGTEEEWIASLREPSEAAAAIANTATAEANAAAREAREAASSITSHTNNTVKHVTAADKSKWNAYQNVLCDGGIKNNYLTDGTITAEKLASGVIPAKTSQIQNDGEDGVDKYASREYVKNAVDEVINGEKAFNGAIRVNDINNNNDTDSYSGLKIESSTYLDLKSNNSINFNSIDSFINVVELIDIKTSYDNDIRLDWDGFRVNAETLFEKVPRVNTAEGLKEIATTDLLPAKTSDLENDGDGTNKFVTFGDYATQTKHGLVKLNPFHGIQATTSGNAVIVPATEKEIDSRSGTYKPITASTIEYAVKSVGDGYYRKEASKVDEGTEIAIADNTEYRLSDVTTLELTYPEGNFECWMLLDFADEGDITVTLPASSYIGIAPTFGNGETWEMSIKDGVIVSAKVGDGT